MPEDDSNCVICRGGKSTKRNLILFCDGEDCDLPVHQDCYGIDEVPDGSWYCERCEDGVLPSETRIVCCPKLTGALKRTTAPTRYMHVVCAAWSKNIDSTEDPYNFNNQELDKQTCYICSRKQGLCVQCEHTFCTKSFHITCALGERLIKPSDTIPDNYQLLCASHVKESDAAESSDELHSIRSKSRSSSTSHRHRSLQTRGRLVQSEDDESDGASEGSGTSDKGNRSVASDVSMDTEKSGSRTPQKLPAKKRKITLNSSSGKRNGDLDLFKDDQSESDDDDDDDEDDDDGLGTRGPSSKKPSNGAHRTSLTTATKSMSLQEMMRNKRKRADMEKSKGLQGLKPATAGLSIDNTLTGSSGLTKVPAPSTSSTPPSVAATTLTNPAPPQQPQPVQQPPKHKLPKNGMGLAANAGLGLGSGRQQSTASSGATQSTATAAIKKIGVPSTTTSAIPSLDFDALQNDIRGGSHKWPLNQSTPALLSPVTGQAPFEVGNGTPSHERSSSPGTPRFGENKKLQVGTPNSRKSDSPALEYSELIGSMKGAMQEMMEGMLTSKNSLSNYIMHVFAYHR
ncbi:PHD-zinc-finger like domain-containing protein [Umbelopsis sp. AD052]|nr:PHD-zinc-finger like domain-containing protein [Umbelopsis sp. AD052]